MLFSQGGNTIDVLFSPLIIWALIEGKDYSEEVLSPERMKQKCFLPAAEGTQPTAVFLSETRQCLESPGGSLLGWVTVSQLAGNMPSCALGSVF